MDLFRRTMVETAENDTAVDALMMRIISLKTSSGWLN